MPATLTEIAREAGVSISLVSRLFRGDKTLRVSEQRRQEIMAVRDRFGGVRVNRAARSLVSKRAHSIIAPINRIFSLNWVQKNLANMTLIKSMEDVLKATDFRFSFCFFDDHQKLHAFEELADSADHCDGVMLLTGIVDEELAGFLNDRKFPHICIGSRAERFNVNTVTTHVASGLRQAVDHLQELGHRQVGFLGPTSPGSLRYPAFVAALADVGLPIDNRFNCTVDPPTPDESMSSWREHTAQAVAQWLDSDPTVTALIALNDYVALGAVDAIRQRGLVPGRDISIVGFGNIEEDGQDKSAEPLLTTIQRHDNQIGRRCGEVLLNQIMHKQRHVVHEYIPTNLIVRQSTGPCPSGGL